MFTHYTKVINSYFIAHSFLQLSLPSIQSGENGGFDRKKVFINSVAE